MKPEMMMRALTIGREFKSSAENNESVVSLRYAKINNRVWGVRQIVVAALDTSGHEDGPVSYAFRWSSSYGEQLENN